MIWLDEPSSPATIAYATGVTGQIPTVAA